MPGIQKMMYVMSASSPIASSRETSRHQLKRRYQGRGRPRSGPPAIQVSILKLGELGSRHRTHTKPRVSARGDFFVPQMVSV